LLGACATKPVAVQGPVPFDEAVRDATDALVAQTNAMPSFIAQLSRRGIVHDPTLDAETAQQTMTTQRLDTLATKHLGTQYKQFDLLPFRSANLANAEYLLVSTLSRDGAAGARTLRIDLALVEIATGVVAAQAGALAIDDGLDHAPLPYYRDSPVLVKDQVVEGYVRTARTPRGQQGDRVYLERIASAMVTNEATDLYNQARYREALGEYRSALAAPFGEQLRVLNGIYMAAAKLGQTEESEAAFARVVAMGIAYRQLSVKFLFEPGGTAFHVDPRIHSPYPMWLRQIAREAVAADVCLDVAGHASRTGKQSVNQALSLRRAARIQAGLVAEAPVLKTRTKAIGLGFEQNLIGTGTDDAIDVLDRRVEFRIVPCGKKG
jgi:outer membrane protein OmpA-like peptidoglycan-associated protein